MKFWWKDFNQKTIQWRNGGPVFSNTNCCCPTGIPYLFYTTDGGGQMAVSQIAFDLTSAGVQIYNGNFPTSDLTITSTGRIYFTEGLTGFYRGISYVEADGSGYTNIYSSDTLTPANLTHSSTKIYFTTNQQDLCSIDYDGSNFAQLLTDFNAYARNLHYHNGYIYYVTFPGFGEPNLIKVSTSGTKTTLISESTTTFDPSSLWVTDNLIYMTDNTDTGGGTTGIVTCNLDGSNKVELYDATPLLPIASLTAISVDEARDRCFFGIGDTLVMIDLAGTLVDIDETAGSSMVILGTYPHVV